MLDDLLSSDSAPILLTVLAALVAAPGLISFIRQARRQDQLGERLERRGDAAAIASGPAKPKSPGFLDGLLASFAKNAKASGGDQGVSAIRFKLLQAGYLNDNAVAVYYGARFAGVVVPQVALLFALPQIQNLDLGSYAPLLVSGFLAIAGLAAPGVMVDRRISARRLECSEGFPDMMDLLVACVEAGLSLDASVARVADELGPRYPTLAYNLRMISLELRAGRARQDAWRSFADRIGLEEASALATMLRQSEEMGTSLGTTMRVFSSDMRQRRILSAEEKAMALPAKLTVPLIIFVFPVLLGVLITPAIIKIQQTLG